jgi:predicted CopG family antitoxin
LTQKNHRTIVVRDDTYETLKHLGTVTESFNDVILKLIQKAVSAQDSFHGAEGQTAAEPYQPGGRNG